MRDPMTFTIHRSFRKLALTIFALLWMPAASTADPFFDPMDFTIVTTGGNCPSCTWIRAYGSIGPDTPDRFRQFVEAQEFHYTGGIQVHLGSPGGSLSAGVELGRMIRHYGMSTVVSTSGLGEEYPGGHRKAIPVDYMVTCASACNFAFLGGVVRYASSRTPEHEIGYQKIGRLGAHQFYNSDALIDPEALTRTANDAITDQLVVAHLLSFLDDMGISAEFLQIASGTPPTDLRYLDDGELLRTDADNYATRDVFIVGYKNGVAITELRFARPDADYRIELYCARGEMRMLAGVEWRGSYDIEAHHNWNILDGLSLEGADGSTIPLRMIEETLSPVYHGMKGSFRFATPSGTLANIVGLKRFVFRDGSSRYASQAADALSFELPSSFEGLYLLPRSCQQ